MRTPDESLLVPVPPSRVATTGHSVTYCPLERHWANFVLQEARLRGGIMREFDGKVCVVTGGAGGIGRALARRFVDAGMGVVLADVEAEALDPAVGELGHHARGVRCDVTSKRSRRPYVGTGYSCFPAMKSTSSSSSGSTPSATHCPNRPSKEPRA